MDRFFAGPITEHRDLYVAGNFMSDTGSVASDVVVSRDCFTELPPVGELVVVRVWTQDGPNGTEFMQQARAVTEEEKAELELLDENGLGEWMRSRTF